MNRRSFLSTTALTVVGSSLAACGVFSSSTTNGVTTLTVNLTDLQAWGNAIINAGSLFLALAGMATAIGAPAAAAIAAVSSVAKADLANVVAAAGGSTSFTFNSTSVPAAISSLLADGQKLLGLLTAAQLPAGISTAAQGYIAALQVVVSTFAALVQGAASVPTGAMSISTALTTLHAN